MTKTSWNGRLRSERERLWPKQQGAGADALGIARETMSRYEAGKVAPGLDVLTRLEAKGVDVLYVITGRRESKRPTFAVLEADEPATKALAPAPSPAHQTHANLREPPPKWGITDAERMARHQLPAIKPGEVVYDDVGLRSAPPDIPHLGASQTGGCALAVGGGLLSLADASTAPPLRLPIAFNGGQTKREFQVLPRFRATASAGKTDGRRVEAENMLVDAAGVLAMDRTFMRAELGSDKAGFITIKVQGDSMERTLIDGEVIIIDSDVVEVSASGIYVVQVGRNLLVKRLVLRMDGGLLVKSDNPAYSAGDVEYTVEQAQSLRIVGRMVWPRFR